MKSHKILYTSPDVRKAIIEIFSKSKGRRVAISAFVGSGAEAYLPKPGGIDLICWPKAGGTNPDALRKLIDRGVKVSFADALHMKIYWTEDVGAVITSANLSTNALGAGNLREIGVLTASKEIDINKILLIIHPRPATKNELLALEKAHHAYEARDKFISMRPRDITFPDWLQLVDKPKWKIGYWDISQDISKAAKQISKKEFGILSPSKSIACKANMYKKDDWVLSFRLSSINPTVIRWQPVDYIVRVPRSEKVFDRNYQYEAIQIWSLSKYPPPPFKIDKRFRGALAIAIRKIEVSKFKAADPNKPSKRLIELIRENY